MEIKLRKYGRHYLLLNNPETWPQKCRELLNSQSKLIEEYLIEEKAIEELKKDKENFDCTTCNIFYKQFSEIKMKFESLFLEENQDILCYHATRLMPFEVENIKNNGLSIIDETFLKFKINNLFHRDIINSEELEIINKTNFLNYGKQRIARENKLYFICGNQDIRYTEDNTSDIYLFYNNYGGEVIFKGLYIENPKLLEKLNGISKPYIIICSMPLNDIKDKIRFFIEKLIINYHKGEFYNIKIEFYIDKNFCKVLDVMESDDQTEFIYN